MPNFREGSFFTLVRFKAMDEGENKNNKYAQVSNAIVTKL